jgi:predicted ATPase
MLSRLGLDDRRAWNESVSILVGPNGSGKSSFLRDLANYHHHKRSIVIVCNTPHDRFAGLRGTRRISIGKTEGSPRVIVKNSVVQSLSGTGAEFYRISATLEYCGYRPRFGFRIDPAHNYHEPLQELRQRYFPHLQGDYKGNVGIIPTEDHPPNPKYLWDPTEEDLALTESFLRRHDPIEPIWVDSTDTALEFSRAREFASVLKLEPRLRAWGAIHGMRVYLQRDNGDVIEMQHASSGQLALISSLLFIITNAAEDPIVIVDEPENSLHPNWQREYVDQMLAALSYRNATVILATHAPLVVTGALASNPDIVSVFEVRSGTVERLPIDPGDSPSSIEEILWQAFDVVTPANHFVSERIVDEMSLFEKGEVPKEQVLSLIERMEAESFDPRQRSFFKAVKQLLDKVEANRDTLS